MEQLPDHSPELVAIDEPDIVGALRIWAGVLKGKYAPELSYDLEKAADLIERLLRDKSSSPDASRMGS